MSLDKLGNSTLQKIGNTSAEQSYDQKTHQLLSDIREELTLMRFILVEMTGFELEVKDIQQELE